MRALMDVPDSLLAEVDEIARREKISRAEAVRRALRDFVSRQKSAAPNSAFGIWKSRKIDALDYEDSIRRDWDR